MIVRTFEGLKAFSPPPTWGRSVSTGSVSLYGLNQPYADIYATQPNVRTCVDFLSRNIAQIPWHLYRRVSDTDRERLSQHPLLEWLNNPNPTTTEYRLRESLVADLALYFRAYWLKVRDVWSDGRERIGLVRLSPDHVTLEGGLLAQRVVYTANGRREYFDLSEVVVFDGYNPSAPFGGLSPLDTLRRTLAEEAAAGEHRERFWLNAARYEGVVQQQQNAPNYNKVQLDSLREQLQEYASGGAHVGRAAILPRGFEFTQASFSPKDAEYVSSRKLTREECASHWHIPLPLVGILEHATFSNIKEQHKHLYVDCLGPWFQMIVQEIERQLLIECALADQDRVYMEFNIAEKLNGSFEEQAQSLQMMVGRPFMTANEARAKLNLPSVKNDPTADQLASQQGGPSSATAPTPVSDVDGDEPVALSPVQERVVIAVRDAWFRQGSRLARVATLTPDERVAALDPARCARELSHDLLSTLGSYAAEYARAVTDETVACLRAGDDPFPADRKVPHARYQM